MRCPQCNMFVAYDDEPQIEIEGEDEFSETFEANVRLVLCCYDCGEELKEALFDVLVPIEHSCPTQEELGEKFESLYELVDTETEATDRYETLDRHGRQIKNPRYWRHYYGCDLTIKVKCVHCGDVIELETSMDEQASAFEELV